MTLITRVTRPDSLASLHERMNRLMGGVFGEEFAGRRSWVPALDVVELPEEVVVKVEVPGIDAKDIDISVNGEFLEISGEKVEEKASDEAKWYRYERHTGSFHRTLELPVAVDSSRVEAETSNGLLTIRLPKRADDLPKRISVKARKA